MPREPSTAFWLLKTNISQHCVVDLMADKLLQLDRENLLCAKTRLDGEDFRFSILIGQELMWLWLVNWEIW